MTVISCVIQIGGAVSAVQVNTCVQVAVLPQSSEAIYVRVWDREHPSGITAPRDEVIVVAPQESVAMASPAAGTSVGLQPKSDPGGQNVNSGGVKSNVQVKTWIQVDVFPHPSVATYVRVCDLKQPSAMIEPRDEVIVGVPQVSVAMANPGAGTPVGLQPRSAPAGQNVNVGGNTSTVHVNSCVQVDVFPHPSVAVYVRVCDLKHPFDEIAPSDEVMVGSSHSSVAVAAPGAGISVGLQPRSDPEGQNVNTGGVTSTVQINS